jgi:hypothetical protein
VAEIMTFFELLLRARNWPQHNIVRGCSCTYYYFEAAMSIIDKLSQGSDGKCWQNICLLSNHLQQILPLKRGRNSAMFCWKLLFGLHLSATDAIGGLYYHKMLPCHLDDRWIEIMRTIMYIFGDFVEHLQRNP